MKLPKPMTPEQIKKAIDDVDISQAGLARDLKVSRSIIHQVIHNTATSHRVRCHIAKAIKQPVGIIWPIKEDPTKVGRPLTKGLYGHQAA
ncbi:MAG: hypothetical protein L3J69_05970 [Desulfobacula sp.]|nr:hypothetical protein [Desulfobacula sp.]